MYETLDCSSLGLFPGMPLLVESPIL